jgi:hypothetical protein
MKNQFIAGFLIFLVLGISSNSAATNAQIITPVSTLQGQQQQQQQQPIQFQQNQPSLPVSTVGGGQQIQGQQQATTQPVQNLQSPLLTNTPEGLNQANNLANFNLSVQDKQSLTEFFNKCPSGIILYKVNGQFFVYCFQTPTTGKLFGLHGQAVTTEIRVITKHITDSSNGNNNGGKKGGSNNNDNEPDGDCLFNASLPKCNPDEDGNCPDDFNLNEDGNCFPDHSDEGCPEGTHGVDDDETGQCYDSDEGCPDGMTFREDGQSCGYTDELCPDENNPNCEETPVTDEEPIVPITPLTTPTTDDPALLAGFGIAPTPIDTLNGEPLVPITETDEPTDPAALDEDGDGIANEQPTGEDDQNDQDLEEGSVDEQPDFDFGDTTDTDTDTDSSDSDSGDSGDSGDNDQEESEGGDEGSEGGDEESEGGDSESNN